MVAVRKAVVKEEAEAAMTEMVGREDEEEQVQIFA